MKIKVSMSTFNEIAFLMEKEGRKIADGVGGLTLEKNDQLIDPIDWRGATVRKDCLMEAVKMKTGDTDININVIELANQMYEFVLKGELQNQLKVNTSLIAKIDNQPKEEWK